MTSCTHQNTFLKQPYLKHRIINLTKTHLRKSAALWLIELKGTGRCIDGSVSTRSFPFFSPYTEISWSLRRPDAHHHHQQQQSVSQDKHGRQSWRKRLGISALKFALLKRGLNTDPRRPLKPPRRTKFSTRWVRAVSLTAVTPSIIRQWISFTRHGIFSESRALYFVTGVCSYICLWDVIILCLKWMYIN